MEADNTSSHRRRLGRDVRPALPRRTRTFEEEEELVAYARGGYDHVRSHHEKVPCSGEEPSSHSSTSESGAEEHVIELMDGLVMPLRMTEETEMAWATNRHSEACCFVCETRIACVDDCDSFICPECLSIVPLERKSYLEGSLSGSLSWSVPHRGGVGIGLKIG